jgi:hypothetical protein
MGEEKLGAGALEPGVLVVKFYLGGSCACGMGLCKIHLCRNCEV